MPMDKISITDEMVRAKITALMDCDYSKLVQQYVDWELLYEEYDGEYEGEAVFIYCNSENQLGLSIFGYGSCSGCDALESAKWKYESEDDTAEFQSLIVDTINNTRWFDDFGGMIRYVNSPDYELQWYGNRREFVLKAIVETVKQRIEAILSFYSVVFKSIENEDKEGKTWHVKAGKNTFFNFYQLQTAINKAGLFYIGVVDNRSTLIISTEPVMLFG